MPRKMIISLVGVPFTDTARTDVGSSGFGLDHDFFTRQDLEIHTAAGGGGALLAEDTDFTLTDEDDDLSQRVTDAVGSGHNAMKTITIINVAYQTGTLYFCGKYIADENDPADWNIPLFIPQPWMKNLAAVITTPTFSGSCNADISMALKDATKNFTTVVFGDIVQNTTSKAFATVLYRSGPDTLYLDADIFPAGNEAYKVFDQQVVSEQEGLEDFLELTGAKLDGDGVKAADTDTLNHLKDADGTSWTGLVSVGDWAMNLATGKVAKVTVIAAHDLTLQWDCFPNGDEKYLIFAGYVTISDALSPLDGVAIPEMNIGGYFLGGGLSAGNIEDDAIQDHWHSGGAALANQGSGGSPNYYMNTSNTGPTAGAHASDHTQPRTLRVTMIMRIK